MTYHIVQHKLRSNSDSQIAEHSLRFFKTGAGEYGEGDRFLGIRVPVIRNIAGEFKGLPLNETEKLLASPYHEERLCALFILVHLFQNTDEETQKEIFEIYLRNTKWINSWDLVDSSAHHIVGAYLLHSNQDRDILYTLARSNLIWERRIAVMATFHFIKAGQFNDTLNLAEILLRDEEDLIHKAVGWMLREVGKRDLQSEENFLNTFSGDMPRTMLRYAIEKFPEAKREHYLNK